MVAKRSTWIAGFMLTIYLLTLALHIPLLLANGIPRQHRRERNDL